MSRLTELRRLHRDNDQAALEEAVFSNNTIAALLAVAEMAARHYDCICCQGTLGNHDKGCILAPLLADESPHITPHDTINQSTSHSAGGTDREPTPDVSGTSSETSQSAHAIANANEGSIANGTKVAAPSAKCGDDEPLLTTPREESSHDEDVFAEYDRDFISKAEELARDFYLNKVDTYDLLGVAQRILARLEAAETMCEFEREAGKVMASLARAAEKRAQVAEAMCEWLADRLEEADDMVLSAYAWKAAARDAVEWGAK